jgi:[Skp1-protein]-hydroxyproline N-acetylglucosaminyltransferase
MALRETSRPIGEVAFVGLLLSGVFVVVTILFLLCFAASNPLHIRTGGALVSVERLVEAEHSDFTELDKIKVKSLRGKIDNIDSTVSLAEISEDEELITVEESISILDDFLKSLHKGLSEEANGKRDFRKYHQIYHDLAVEKLYKYDLRYFKHMPKRRDDDSIYLSVASYRDENCFNTLSRAYEFATNPNKLNVGLVQQNCVANCMSGVLVGGKVEPVPPDDDCYQLFCGSEIGKPHCDAGRIRVLRVNETESLGPYTARYFASKLWDGESWFMQIDSHMNFAQGWDSDSVTMLLRAPSDKPIISHYPPECDEVNFTRAKLRPAPRICGAIFSESHVEHQIIRLDECDVYDKNRLDIPRFAPFVAAGYFVAHSDFLRDVPFDPFLPWVFMGEEIIMSARLWTFGYDIFSPTHSVVGHMYVRRHKPKYWESVWRFMGQNADGMIEERVIHRLKYQLGYVESAPDLVWPSSVFFGLNHYTMGTLRSVDSYMEMVGLDPVHKKSYKVDWCRKGQPPGFNKDKAYLYNEIKNNVA